MPDKNVRDERVAARLRRIEGQVKALVRMVENQEYCIDILTQIAAARAALLAAGKIVLAEHMRSCVVRSFEQGQSAQAIREIEAVLEKFIR